MNALYSSRQSPASQTDDTDSQGSPSTDPMGRLEVTLFSDRPEVRIVYRHHPTFSEWRAMMESILADPRFHRGSVFLFDKRAASSPASNAYVEAVAEFYREHRAELGRCAIVVSNVLAFGMSRMTEGYCVDGNVRAFMDIEGAEKWLQAQD